MKSILIGILVLSLFSGCSVATPKQQGYIDNKTPLYTQRTIWIRNRGSINHPGNDFEVSGPFLKDTAILPVNSKVTVWSFKKHLALKYRGRVIFFVKLKVVDENGKYTAEAKQKFFDDLLQPIKIDLSKFTELEQKNIELNEVAKGMSKEAVVVSIGSGTYPMTFSYDDDKWYYGNFLLIIFKDNKVVKIKDNRILMTKEVGNTPFK